MKSERWGLCAFLLLSTIWAASLGGQVSGRSPGDVYQKWLDEDVVYIITSEERAQYLRLTNNKDRDQFIVQFWLRRDPTPGTPENEFKEEHYRRIAFANIHFADSVAGWRTDRGRIYILNGPPEETEMLSPSLSTGPIHATQTWHYKDGRRFRFTDACDCGEYHLDLKP